MLFRWQRFEVSYPCIHTSGHTSTYAAVECPSVDFFGGGHAKWWSIKKKTRAGERPQTV